ncbi:MAG: PDZ domain-containing protein, partial [Chloroflexota bacterium]|nr:PDZ domain-containing protein [Chloroflexota bacterium]
MRKNLSQVLLIALALLVLGAGLRAYVYERRMPALGFLWNNTGGAVYAVHRGGPAEAAGVRVGDVFLEMEGVPVVERDRFRHTWEAVPSGQDVSIVVERNGEYQFLVLFTAPMAPRLEGFAIYYWIATIFWGSGVVVYLARGHDRVSALFLLFCLATAAALFANTNVNLIF